MTMNLEVARTIQEGLRPKSDVSIPGISLAAESQSCDETNGDYLDFFELGEERLGFVVADVSGHGIGPAIIMSGTRGLFRAYRRKAPNIDGVLDQVNHDLHVDLQGANFVTFFYGEVDVHANTLTYGSAGHPPAVLINCHGHTELLPRTGIALGMFGDEKYESKTCPFEPGDLIAVYTDGLTEMAAPSGDLYGEDRLVEFLIENREAEPEQIIARLLTEIETFSDQAPRTDDITLLLARRT
jgi:sigma-B regulation protein RsbU (phosphoserine phosphatase)